MALDEDGGVTLWELQWTKKASVTPKVTPNLNRTRLMIFKCNFTAGQSLKSSKPGSELSCRSEGSPLPSVLFPPRLTAQRAEPQLPGTRRAGGQAVLLSGLSLVTLRVLISVAGIPGGRARGAARPRPQ